MDDLTKEPEPPRGGESEPAGLPEGSQGAGNRPATNPLAPADKQRPVLGPDGKFLPGVLQPVGKPWKPGQSGNPSGVSKAGRVTRRLVEALEKDNGRLADAITNVILKRALSGDYKFIQEIINRSEGRVPDRLAGHDGGPLAALPSITVIKTYEGERPVGEAATEEQPPQPPQPSPTPRLR